MINYSCGYSNQSNQIISSDIGAQQVNQQMYRFSKIDSKSVG